jgi:hypothetical protein
MQASRKLRAPLSALDALWRPPTGATHTRRPSPSPSTSPCPHVQVKFLYDHVFEPHTQNQAIYKTVASPIVMSALDGINGTIFACACVS